MDGKKLLDLIEKGLKARQDYRERKHTESERRRVEEVETELTVLLTQLDGRKPATE